MKMAPSATVFFFWLSHSHFSTKFNIQTHFELVVTSTLAPYSFQKKIIQNGVNIQDGDFTFSHQSVLALYFRHFQTYKHQILDSDRKLYKNK
jgi:hypothetical protein